MPILNRPLEIDSLGATTSSVAVHEQDFLVPTGTYPNLLVKGNVELGSIIHVHIRLPRRNIGRYFCDGQIYPVPLLVDEDPLDDSPSPRRLDRAGRRTTKIVIQGGVIIDPDLVQVGIEQDPINPGRDSWSTAVDSIEDPGITRRDPGQKRRYSTHRDGGGRVGQDGIGSGSSGCREDLHISVHQLSWSKTGRRVMNLVALKVGDFVMDPGRPSWIQRSS